MGRRSKVRVKKRGAINLYIRSESVSNRAKQYIAPLLFPRITFIRARLYDSPISLIPLFDKTKSIQHIYLFPSNDKWIADFYREIKIFIYPTINRSEITIIEVISRKRKSIKI